VIIVFVPLPNPNVPTWEGNMTSTQPGKLSVTCAGANKGPLALPLWLVPRRSADAKSPAPEWCTRWARPGSQTNVKTALAGKRPPVLLLPVPKTPDAKSKELVEEEIHLLWLKWH